MAAFNPTIDSWAPGDPIPIINPATPLAPDAKGLTGAGAGSDLFTGQAAPVTSSGRLYVSPGPGSDVTTSSGYTMSPSEAAANQQLSGTFGDISNLASKITGIGSGNAAGNLSGQQIAGVSALATEAAQFNWGNLFIRIILVILGLILIAAGLHMLGLGTPVDRVTRSVRAVTPGLH